MEIYIVTIFDYRKCETILVGAYPYATQIVNVDILQCIV